MRLREEEGKDEKETHRLSLNFGHDKTLAFGLTALGLAHDDKFPEKGPLDPHRRWRSAELVPFASYMLWKRLECEEAESRIQLVLNGANYGLEPTGCEIDAYGTCALDDFLGTDRVRAALNVSHGDARWKAACEHRVWRVREDGREKTKYELCERLHAPQAAWDKSWNPGVLETSLRHLATNFKIACEAEEKKS